MKLKSPHVLLIIAPLIWGGNFVLGRAITGEVPPYTLSFLRWCTAFIVFMPFIWKRMKTEIIVLKKNWFPVLIMAISGVAGFNTLLYIALNYTTSINASLVVATTPIVIGIFSYAVLGEQLNARRLTGIILSVIGVGYILSQGSVDVLMTFSFNRGDLLATLSVFCWAIYSITIRKYSGIIPLYSSLAITMLISIFLLLPFYLWETFYSGKVIIWSAASVLTILYVGILASIVAFLAWNTAVSQIGASNAGIYLNLIPVFAAIMAIIFIGENLSWAQLIGGGMAITGVFISSSQRGMLKKNISDSTQNI